MKRRRRLDILLLLLSSLALLLAHLEVFRNAPLVRYGFRGAEYLEHIQRQYALNLTHPLSWWQRLVHSPDHLALLDGQYPALLHIFAAAWARVFGDGIPESILLNIPFLVLVAVASAWLARELEAYIARDPLVASPGNSTRANTPQEKSLYFKWLHGNTQANSRDGTTPSGRRTSKADTATFSISMLAAILVLLTPAIFATARRYYYDLPLAAWCALASASLFAARRSRGWFVLASIATALACLTKWQAVLYLAPVWIFAGVSVLRRQSFGGLLQSLFAIAGSAMILLTLCWPVIRRSDRLGAFAKEWLGDSLATTLGLDMLQRHGSFDDALGQATALGSSTAGAIGPHIGLADRILFYLDGLASSSLGWWLSIPLLLAVIVGFRRWRSALPLLMILAPMAFLVARVSALDERFILPLLPLLLAFAAASRSQITHPSLARGLSLGLVLCGFVQFLCVEGILPQSWGARASTDFRGWNLRGQLEPSPWRSYLQVAEAACKSEPRPSAVVLSPRLQEIHAWRWAVTTACRGVDLRVGGRVDDCSSNISPATEGQGPERKGNRKEYIIPTTPPTEVGVRPAKNPSCGSG